jgi:lactoylglutathione lyase
MQLNHTNLVVADVQANRRFLEKYLGLQSMEGTKDNDTHVGLLDDNGFVLTLLEAEPGTEVHYPESFHIGFLKESEDRVHEIYERLKEDGYEVQTPGYFRGEMLDLYFPAPGGFTIQVSY